MTARLAAERNVVRASTHPTSLEHLAHMELLIVDSSKVTDVGLEHLKGLTSLRSMSIQYTKVTTKGVERLRQALPSCAINAVIEQED